MNAQMLKALLHEHLDSPDLLLEAYKLGCVDERMAAKRRSQMTRMEAHPEVEQKEVARLTEDLQKTRKALRELVDCFRGARSVNANFQARNPYTVLEFKRALACLEKVRC